MYWALRHDPRKYTIAHCYRRVAFEAKKNGWSWFNALVTCGVWDLRTRDARALVLNREGEHAYAAKVGSYLEPDPTSWQPNQSWESDHSTVNVWCRIKTGKIIRPALTTWLDWRSRCVVGHRLVIVGNQESILVAFRDGALRYGLPDEAVMDNGKDFSAYIWTGGRPKRNTHRLADDFGERTNGIFALLGVHPRWVLPYSPNSKGRVERLYRTFNEDFSKAWPSYCGNAPANRPEAHKHLIEKAVDFDEFAAKLRDWFDLYNNKPHSADDMAGRTPLQAMAQATRKRVLTEQQGTFLLAAWPRPLRLNRQGVSLRLAGQTLRYGAFRPELNRLEIGTPLRISYDPQDLRYVNIWSMDGRFICRAEENHRFNRRFTTEEHRETLRGRRRQMRTLREAGKVGLDLLRDPVTQTLAAQAHDADRHRKPDPEPPEGGPVLIPLQTPIEVPPKERVALRKAVGAEGPPDDFRKRFDQLGKDGRAAKPRSAKTRGGHRSGRIAAACNMETLIDHVAVELWHPDRGEGRHPGDAA